MAPKGWIDKKSATHFTLVHRPQNDPLVHDSEASSMVFAPTTIPNQRKVKSRKDLESELHLEENEGVRVNEGEAAEHGIYFDDSQYDYMQHLREIGGGEGVFVEAKAEQAKGKEKMKLEDALAAATLESTDGTSQYAESAMLDSSILPSQQLRRTTYQDQQDVPDTIAGFQPDMDPRLREVLEALDDEAYVDDDEDVFGELSKDGAEIDLVEFEASGSSFDRWREEDEGEDGWESDDTAKPDKEFREEIAGVTSRGVPVGDSENNNSGDWMAEYSKFKQASSKPVKRPAVQVSGAESSILSSQSSLTGGRRKKRKGAITNSSTYSMTSSSIARTEGLTLLDSRFDKIAEEYADDYEDGQFDDVASSFAPSVASSNVSSVMSGPARSDFDGMMDEFLGSHKSKRKNKPGSGTRPAGLDQLDEIRKNLGPARVRAAKV